MAGEWLKFEKATPDKPEVFAIASRLDMDPDAVVGKLIRVWSWFDTHTVDGNGAGVTRPLLDRIAGVTGFVAAMEAVAWIKVTAAGVSLPNFDRHTGETAKSRALGAKRASDHRAKSNAESNADSVTPTVTAALPREEKRREEESKASNQPDGCPHSEIIDLYHEALPASPRVKSWTDTRRANLRARWREDAKRQSLDYWRRLFAHCGASAFLTGRVTGKGDRPFFMSLDWLVKPENFAKVIEGRYHDKGDA